MMRKIWFKPMPAFDAPSLRAKLLNAKETFERVDIIGQAAGLTGITHTQTFCDGIDATASIKWEENKIELGNYFHNCEVSEQNSILAHEIGHAKIRMSILHPCHFVLAGLSVACLAMGSILATISLGFQFFEFAKPVQSTLMFAASYSFATSVVSHILSDQLYKKIEFLVDEFSMKLLGADGMIAFLKRADRQLNDESDSSAWSIRGIRISDFFQSHHPSPLKRIDNLERKLKSN